MRSDSIGDVLLAEPALRAIARTSDLTLLCSPHGRAAVDVLGTPAQVLVFDAPWISADPPPLHAGSFARLVRRIAAGRFDRAVVFTSERQSPLPMAMALRLAGVPLIGAHSDHYPGSLLDVRLRPLHTSHADGSGQPEHEVERNLRLAEAMGFPPPEDRRIRVTGAAQRPHVGGGRYVVVHPGATAPARTPSPDRWIAATRALLDAGHDVVVTGHESESAALDVAAAVPEASSLVGRTTLRELVPLLTHASAVCVGNTGIMHLAAAVGTPVVALFPPTVPLARWRPWKVPHVVLGDHGVDCALCHLRRCRFEDHPCGAVPARDVVDAVDAIGRQRQPSGVHAVAGVTP